MRWPLKNQILIRMLLLLVLTIAAITFANIRAIMAANHSRQLDHNKKIAKLLRRTHFPLTSTVLENMHTLSGAEFAVVDRNGHVFSKTDGAPTSAEFLKLRPDDLKHESMVNPIMSGGAAYYHSMVEARPDPNGGPARTIHIFIPRQTETMIWWAASRSPLWIAAFVLPLACLIGLAMASHVTRPLAKLKRQVQRISEGKAISLQPPSTHDEIHDLNLAVNEMAVKLQNHDQQLVQNERLRTMVQFGNGIAHHLRNSATGCQLAIELLGTEQRGIAETDNYRVAIRQIGLMNNTIKKFLLLSKSLDANQRSDAQDVDLCQSLERVIFLLQPTANHLEVELTVKDKGDRLTFLMAEEDAEQLMMNLITNAITAASSIDTSGCENREGGRGAPHVTVELFRSLAGPLIFRTIDNGPGPPAEIAETLFQPFVTGSREGAGLGLSLVREIADRVGGKISWQRVEKPVGEAPDAFGALALESKKTTRSAGFFHKNSATLVTVFTFEFGHQTIAQGAEQ